MKNKLLKTLLPIATITSFATMPALVSCGETKPKEIFISNAPKEMFLNEELTLIVTSNPEKAYKGVTWLSSKPTVISIDENSGVIKAEGLGCSIITAQSDKYPDVRASCSIEVVEAFEYDLTNDFKPKTEPLKGELDQSIATKTYLENASANKAIIADDLVFGWYQTKLREQGYTKISINVSKVDVTNSLISLQYHSKGEIKITGDVMTSQDVIFENIPISVSYISDETPFDSNWGIAPNINSGEWFFENENWHFYEKDTYQTAEPIVHDWDKEKLNSDPSGLTAIIMALAFSIPSISYYLSETAPAQK